MQIIEIGSSTRELTLRQRWANMFTTLLAVALLLTGFNLRNQITNATDFFDSPQAGITAYYPHGWLIDSSGDYVFRVRDMVQRNFKTTFQVSVKPVGPDAQERNVADRLTLDRIQTFTAYQVLSQETYALSDAVSGQALNYVYVNSDASPFLEGIPTVVRGLDILVISGGQAIIVTYRAGTDVYDSEFPRFEQFLRGLRF